MSPPAARQAADPTAPKEPFGLLQVLLLFGVVVALAFAAPFLGGVQNIIGIFIIGFALWEAWKINRQIPLVITGPYQIGPGEPTAHEPSTP